MKKPSLLLRTIAGVLRQMPRSCASWAPFLRVFKALIKAMPKPSLTADGNMIVFPDDRGKETSLSFSRYVRRKLELSSSDISDSDLAALSNAITAEVNFATACFASLRGKAVIKAYHKAVGGNSCMTDRPGHTRLYEENPDRVEMLTLRTANGTARALVWNLEDGTKILDRIYPGDGGSHMALFYKWAERNKAYIRAYNGAPETGHSIPFVQDSASVRSGGRTSGTGPAEGFEIRLRFPSTDLMPYMDTFHYGVLQDEYVTLFTSPRPMQGLMFFNRTDGTYTVARICPMCKQIANGEFRISGGKLVCDSCYRHSLVTCDICRKSYPTNGMLKEKVTYAETVGKVRVCKDCVDFKLHVCELCGNYEKAEIAKVRMNKASPVSVCRVCDSGRTNCSKCNALVPRSKTKKLWSGSGSVDICEDCISEYSIKCTKCESTVLFKGSPEDMEQAMKTFVCDECKLGYTPLKIDAHFEHVVDAMKL